MSDDRIDSRDERILILRDKAAREGFVVSPEVLDYIAERYALPQTLKGALINVAAYASRRGIPVDMETARLVLEGVRPGSPPVDLPAPPVEPTLEETLAGVLDVEPAPLPEPEPHVMQSAPEPEPHVIVPAPEPRPVAPQPQPEPDDTLFVAEAPPLFEESAAPSGPATAAPAPVATEAVTRPGFAPPAPKPSVVWFAPVRSVKKESLVTRAGRLAMRAGLADVIDADDKVAIKLHFGEEGNTGFVQPVFLREIVRLVREAGGKPFLTDSNTLYRGKRANAVDHLACAIHNGFSFATVEAPLIIADGLDGREAVDVEIKGFDHFDSVRIGSAAVHADAMVVVTHVKGHEATGFGGAMKNVGMGLGSRSAKQRMHSDLKPEVTGEKCTACGRCVKWCPVNAIAITPDRIARIDYELCYGCGECVAACPEGAIGIQWKTEPDAIQEKIVEHVAGAVAGKEGKVIYLSFITNVSPDCDCWHFSDASIVPDIGVLASTDIVAIDQASYDLVKQSRGLSGSRGEGMAEGSDKFQAITGIDGTLAMDYAEKHGLGSRAYELRTME